MSLWDPKNPNKLSPDIIEKLRPIIKDQDKTLKDDKQPNVNNPVIKESTNNH